MLARPAWIGFEPEPGGDPGRFGIEPDVEKDVFDEPGGRRVVDGELAGEGSAGGGTARGIRESGHRQRAAGV